MTQFESLILCQDKYQIFFEISGIIISICSFRNYIVRKMATAFCGCPYFYPYAPTALINGSMRSALSYFIFSVTWPYASRVKADIIRVQFRHHEFECPVQCLRCYPVFNLVREDQTIFNEVTAKAFPIDILCLLGFPKQIHRKGCRSDGVLFAVLGGNQCVLLLIAPYLSPQAL